MRTFIAVKINDNLRGVIDTTINDFRDAKELINVRWVPPENLHITCKFLGNASKQNIQLLKGLLIDSLAYIEPFQSKLNQFQFFPSGRVPHVLVIDIDNTEPWIELARTINLITTDVGFEPEKRDFTPHLTVGRVKGHVDKFDFSHFNFVNAQIHVDEVVIYESVQESGKVRYEELEVIALGSK